jgi:mannose-6-phosphate isomerase-like protein (cupin superfamily)
MKTLITTIILLAIISVSFAQSKLEEKDPIKRVDNAFDIIKRSEAQNTNYGVFMRMPSISSGVYTLKKGQADGQNPHTRDEIYYVMKGKSKISIGSETFDVKEGALIFVEAYKEHKFFDITEDLAIVVFFSAEQGEKQKN